MFVIFFILCKVILRVCKFKGVLQRAGDARGSSAKISHKKSYDFLNFQQVENLLPRAYKKPYQKVN